MNKRKKIAFLMIWDAILLLAFVVFTVIVSTCDVCKIDGAAAEVGLSKINEFFFARLHYNDVLYSISKYLGYALFLIIAYFGFLGLKQLIEKKSVFKVDKEILLFGGMCVVMLSIYVLFEKAIINYRPIIVDASEGIEASYPSSHTFLAICLCGAGIIMFGKYIQNKNVQKLVSISLAIAGIIVVLCRFLSAVHWFTDIVGSLILGAFVIMTFYTCIKMWGER